jgi:hypothetical protein
MEHFVPEKKVHSKYFHIIGIPLNCRAQEFFSSRSETTTKKKIESKTFRFAELYFQLSKEVQKQMATAVLMEKFASCLVKAHKMVRLKTDELKNDKMRPFQTPPPVRYIVRMIRKVHWAKGKNLEQ